jgi:hypothetical protein
MSMGRQWADRFSMAPRPVMFGDNAGAAAPAPAPAPIPATAPAPAASAAQEADALPAGWERKLLAAPDAEGRTAYFVNHHTQTTHWALPAPDYRPPEATKRDLFDIHVPAGCGPGSEVIASGFHVRVPPGVHAGQTFRVQFLPTPVTVPLGAYAGVTTTVWVEGLKGRVTIPQGFGPGERFTIMAPSNRTEDDHQLHVEPAPLPTGWELKHTPDGKPYYVNHHTQKTQWERPAGLTPAPALPSPAAPASLPAPAPAPAPAAGGGPKAYYHIAPDGSRHAMRPEDNAAIEAALAWGDPVVRLSDVVLDNGSHLQFEIRFGTHGGRMAERTGMMQLNLGNSNQREVEEGPALAHVPVPAATQAPATAFAAAPAAAFAAAPAAAHPAAFAAAAAAAAAPAPASVALDKEEEVLDQNADVQAQLLGITDEDEIKKLKKRNMVLCEVVKSEESYCQSLEKIAEFYYEPMKAGNAPDCTDADFKEIFGAFGSLLGFQRGLLKELQKEYALLSSDDTRHFSALPIANVLKKWAPGLKFYRPYVSGYKGGVDCIKRLGGPKDDRHQNETPFKVWLRERVQQCGSDLEFFLIQPIQRIPRYVLLLSELIKYTPDQLQEKQVLVDVHAMVQEQCDWINRNAQLDDSRAKCGELHQQFRAKDLMEDKHAGDLRALETIEGLPGCPGTGLVQSYRRLVLEESASDLLAGKEVRVLVFNDMVIIADDEKEFFSGRQYLRFRDKLNLDADVEPSMHLLRDRAVDLTGRANYQHGIRMRDIRWSLEFAQAHQRDSFIKAVKDNTGTGLPPA